MKNLIKKIMSSNSLKARFLNTLSLLEYIGARKILKSQYQESFHAQLLNHVAEEIRHAQILKRMALKIEPELCLTYAPSALLCGHEATQYFQTIDHAAQEAFSETDPWISYLYTTYLVENRATSFYKMVDEVLADIGSAPLFRGILVEEDRHLDEIKTALTKVPSAKAQLERLEAIEANALSQLIQAIDNAVESVEV
jgi:rubrerythrin